MRVHNPVQIDPRLPVLPQDVSSMARALFASPVRERAGLCQQMFDRAGLAAAHVARTAQLHPRWGNGSLDAVARHSCGPLCSEPVWDHPDYITCLRLVLAELHSRLIPSSESRASGR